MSTEVALKAGFYVKNFFVKNFCPLDHSDDTLGRPGCWGHPDVVQLWDILDTSDWAVTNDRVYIDYYKSLLVSARFMSLPGLHRDYYKSDY